MLGEQLDERCKSRSDNRSRPIGDQAHDRAALGNFVRSIADSVSVKPNTRVLETETIGAWRRPAATDCSSNAEYESLLEGLLTQETSFFRYPDVYQAFERRVLPELHGKKFWNNPRRLRIWSAGCSTGEEPYSVAISVLEALELADAWNVEILATDISRRALDIAERGCYSGRDLESLAPEQIEEHFTAIGRSEYQVKKRLRTMVTFAQMNLAQMVYMGRFDCIFCMNVLIYFSDELRANLIRRFSEYLESDGYLFLGHAESVAKAKVDLEAILIRDSLIYRKSARVTMQETL